MPIKQMIHPVRWEASVRMPSGKWSVWMTVSLDFYENVMRGHYPDHRVRQFYGLPDQEFLHKKSGKRVRPLGIARIQSDVPLNDMDEVALYWHEDDGTLWARRLSEFSERFEEVNDD